MKLWEGTDSSIAAVDGSATYTKQNLVNTLAALLDLSQPEQINTQNYTEEFIGPDHSDHVGTGYFTEAAREPYEVPNRLVAFEDYETASRPANVAGSLLEAKSAAFYTYGAHDSEACQSAIGCENTSYAKWLARQYVAEIEPTPWAVPGPAQTVASAASVSLNGAASWDPNDLELQYDWTQTAGPSAKLSDPSSATPHFAAPTGPVSLTFSLIVSNGTQTSKPAAVTVKVSAPDPSGSGGGNGASPPGGSGGSGRAAQVKLSSSKVLLLVGRPSRHLIKVEAPEASSVRCKGTLPKGVRCRITPGGNVLIESSSTTKRIGTYRLAIHVDAPGGTTKKPLIVRVQRPGGRR
jgi:hypothetical protein